MRLLVTGGAGYIGSIVAAQLLRRGDDVTVLDALAGGYDAVLHFAALALVSESVEYPERYYRVNVLGTLNLLEAMRAAGTERLVFSSTCATYGEPDEVPIHEGVA